jgi:hypothetical protein
MARSRITSMRLPISGLAAGVLVLGLTASVVAQQDRTPLRMTAASVNLNADRAAARTDLVEVQIDRWSSEQERDALIDRLRTGGEKAALAALQKTPRVGFIRTPDRVGWDLHYAREVAGADGGRKIYIATDRPIRFWEAANLTRSLNYPFTLIEIHLDRDGKGEGRMTVATKASINSETKTLELESYSSQPVLLKQVRVQQEPAK